MTSKCMQPFYYFILPAKAEDIQNSLKLIKFHIRKTNNGTVFL